MKKIYLCTLKCYCTPPNQWMVAIAVKTWTQTWIGFHIPSLPRTFCGLCKPVTLIKGSVANIPGLFIGIWKNVCEETSNRLLITNRFKSVSSHPRTKINLHLLTLSLTYIYKNVKKVNYSKMSYFTTSYKNSRDHTTYCFTQCPYWKLKAHNSGNLSVCWTS